jgi:ectoine hydroxylase-related dioxygenase (phytanoyl-CoA dioxygenase family)
MRVRSIAVNRRADDDAILAELARDGYAIAPGVLAADQVAQLRRDLEAAVAAETTYHRGADYQDYGMVLVCCTHARSFVDVLAHDGVMRIIERILGDGCIVYAYTSSSMPPGASNYSERIHVDCPRLIPGYETNAGVMMLLDDFTAENGATWVLPGSQHTREPPSAEYFFANSRRIVAPAGSAVYLNPRVWHAGGKNQTSRWRHSITLNMCRPYMKQRLDIPKMMAASAVDLTGVSDKALQKMGFYAQVPESLGEYYQPLERRKFRQKAE